MAKNKLDQQASITFQAPLSRKEALEHLAFQLGLRRLVDSKETGNVSAVVNLFIEFAFEFKEQFAEWVKARATKAMNSEVVYETH